MKEQSTGGSFLALSFASILVKLLSLLYVPIIIRILGNEGYGIYLASYDIFSLIYVITNSGMQIAIAKQIAEFVALKEHNNVVKVFHVGKRLLFFIGIISTLLLFFLSAPISKLVGSERAYLGIMFLSPTIFFTCILASYRGLFQGISFMGPMAISQVIEQIFNVIISIFFAWFLSRYSLELGAAGGTVGTTLGAIIAILFLFIVMKREKVLHGISNVPYLNCELDRRKEASSLYIIKKFLVYGVPVILTSGIQYVGAVIDLALVKNRLLVGGFDYATSDILYGLLGKYKTLIYVPLSLIVSLSSAVIPGIVKSVTLNETEGLFKKIRFSVKVSLFISIPSCVAMALLSKEIYTILFSTEYLDGYKLMLYGSSLVIFMSIVQIQTTILQGINKFYMVFMSLFIGVILKLFTNYFLISIPSVNINGAVIGSIMCFLIPMIINIFLIRKYTGFKTRILKRSVKPILSSIIMGLSLIAMTKIIPVNVYSNTIYLYIIFLIYVFVGVVVYFVSIILFRYLDKEDLEFLPQGLINKIPEKIKSKFF